MGRIGPQESALEGAGTCEAGGREESRGVLSGRAHGPRSAQGSTARRGDQESLRISRWAERGLVREALGARVDRVAIEQSADVMAVEAALC